MNNKREDTIENALRSEPVLELKQGFSERVLKAIRRKELRNQRKLYFWMMLGILFMLGSGYVIISAFLPELKSAGLFDLGDQFNKAVPFAVLLGILIVGIQYLDKKLIKDRYLFS